MVVSVRSNLPQKSLTVLSEPKLGAPPALLIKISWIHPCKSLLYKVIVTEPQNTNNVYYYIDVNQCETYLSTLLEGTVGEVAGDDL